MSKIMELAEYYATLREDGVRRELEDEARATLAAEVEKLEQQHIDRLLRIEQKVDELIAERDALREKLAIARNAALEEAAKVCDVLFADVPPYSAPDCAAAIRNLIGEVKWKP